LKMDGPQREAPSNWQHLGDCKYKIPYRLTNPGIYTIKLIHGYDNFNALTEWVENSNTPLHRLMLDSYSLAVCPDHCPTLTPAKIESEILPNLPLCSKTEPNEGIYVRKTMETLREINKQNQILGAGPYIWYPLGCRYNNLFEPSSSRSCLNSNRRVLIIGDSQSRTVADLIDARLSGNTAAVASLGSRLKLQKYTQTQSPEPWKDVGTEDDVSTGMQTLIDEWTAPPPATAQGMMLHFIYDEYMGLFSTYHESRTPNFDFDLNLGFVDKALQSVDTIVLGTGQWQASRVSLGGQWTLSRYKHFLEFIMDALDEIQFRRLKRGLKTIRIIWQGFLSTPMHEEDWRSDWRNPVRNKVWSDVAAEIMKRRGALVVDGNGLTVSWVEEYPDSAHPFMLPGLDALIDEIIFKMDLCRE
jgi:hypothetical protein